MKCEECQKEGKTSRVYDPGFGVSTAMCVNTYWDEEGRRHVHDPNRTGISYRCSNGHEWHVSLKTACPSCDYGTSHAA